MIPIPDASRSDVVDVIDLSCKHHGVSSFASYELATKSGICGTSPWFTEIAAMTRYTIPLGISWERYLPTRFTTKTAFLTKTSTAGTITGTVIVRPTSVSKSSPTSTSTPSTSAAASSENRRQGLSTGATVGIGTGTALGMMLMFTVCWLYWRRKHQQRTAQTEASPACNESIVPRQDNEKILRTPDDYHGSQTVAEPQQSRSAATTIGSPISELDSTVVSPATASEWIRPFELPGGPEGVAFKACSTPAR